MFIDASGARLLCFVILDCVCCATKSNGSLLSYVGGTSKSDHSPLNIHDDVDVF